MLLKCQSLYPELTLTLVQPGDRRERLKYVLGQLRQARGEGGDMEVDQGSDNSSDSEDEEVSRVEPYL